MEPIFLPASTWRPVSSVTSRRAVSSRFSPGLGVPLGNPQRRGVFIWPQRRTSTRCGERRSTTPPEDTGCSTGRLLTLKGVFQRLQLRESFLDGLAEPGVCLLQALPQGQPGLRAAYPSQCPDSCLPDLDLFIVAGGDQVGDSRLISYLPHCPR